MANKSSILVIGPRGIYGYEGGVEKFAEEFIPRALKVADVTLLCLHSLRGEKQPGLTVVKMPHSKWFKTDKALLLFYAPLLYARRPFDHVFILGTNLAFLIPIFRTFFWRRAKIHLRSGSIDHKQKKWGKSMRVFMRYTERLCRLANTVIANAPGIQRHLGSLGIPSVLVPNGLDPAARKKESPREAGTVVAVGRITTPKNYGVLIEASHLLGENGPLVTIIGGPDLSGEYNRLQQLIKGKPRAKVHFAGVLDRPAVLNVLKSKALYVNCSVQEGMSNAILEAIQENIPILLSDIEANRDFSLDDRFYFPPDDAAALAIKIKEALASPTSYRVQPDSFVDWDATVKRILTLTEVL